MVCGQKNKIVLVTGNFKKKIVFELVELYLYL